MMETDEEMKKALGEMAACLVNLLMQGANTVVQQAGSGINGSLGLLHVHGVAIELLTCLCSRELRVHNCVACAHTAGAGWVREMYAWDAAVALHSQNIKVLTEVHTNSSTIVQPPFDEGLNRACMCHYTWGALYHEGKPSTTTARQVRDKPHRSRTAAMFFYA